MDLPAQAHQAADHLISRHLGQVPFCSQLAIAGVAVEKLKCGSADDLRSLVNAGWLYIDSESSDIGVQIYPDRQLRFPDNSNQIPC